MTSECTVTSQPMSADLHAIDGRNEITEHMPIVSQNENVKRYTPYIDTTASDTSCLLCCFHLWRDDNSIIHHEGGSVGNHGDCCGSADCCSCHCADAGNCDCHGGQCDCDCGQCDLNCGHCDLGGCECGHCDLGGCDCGQCDLGGCDCNGCDLGGCTF